MSSGHVPVQQLVERAKDGLLPPAEVDAAAERLKREPADEDAYDLLYVVGRTHATRHEDLVASFLDHSDDPMLARLALQILCTFWDLSSRYLDVLKRFVAGVEWDDDGDVRQVALSAAGDFLRDNRDCELFRGVYALCTGAASDDVEERVALAALATALGTQSDGSLKKQKPDLLAEGSAWLAANCGKDR